MNAFQKKCLDALDNVFSAHTLSPHFETVPDTTLLADTGETCLRAEFTHEGRAYVVYIYADEAGTYLDREWYIRETQDYREPEALIASFAAFLRRCLAGDDPARVERES